MSLEHGPLLSEACSFSTLRFPMSKKKAEGVSANLLLA